MNLSNVETALVIEALEQAARRHVSVARFAHKSDVKYSPRQEKAHGDKAAAMRRLKQKLEESKQ